MKKKKEVPFFMAPFLSFYSQKLYKDLCRNWKGFGFFYVFITALIIGGGCFYFGKIYVEDIPQEAIEKVVDKVPTFAIESGQFSTNVQQPYVIDWNVENSSATPNKIIIDTTGKVTELEDDVVLLITENEIVGRNEQTGEIDVIPFAGIPDFALTQDDARAFILKILEHAPTAIAAIAFFAFFIGYSIRLLFYAILASAVVNDSREFKQLCRVTAFALTPGTVLSWLLGLPFIFGMAINVAYVIFAVRSCRPEVEAPAQQPLPMK